MRPVRSGDLSNKHASAAFGATIRECKLIFKKVYHLSESVKLIRSYYVISKKKEQKYNNDTSIMTEKPHGGLSFLHTARAYYYDFFWVNMT